jgi:hypothetical protein
MSWREMNEYRAVGLESSTGEIKISRNIASYTFYSRKAILHWFYGVILPLSSIFRIIRDVTNVSS